MKSKITLVGIAGSLRATASSAALLKAVQLMAPADVELIIYEGLGSLPHFNDSAELPEPVAAFSRLIKDADGVFICSPEYAYGVPGVLKNCLDWSVGSGIFYDKPVAFITAATGGEHAYASLMLTFTALSAKISKDATLMVSFIRSKLNAHGEITDAAIYEAVKAVLDSLVETIKS